MSLWWELYVFVGLKKMAHMLYLSRRYLNILHFERPQGGRSYPTMGNECVFTVVQWCCSWYCCLLCICVCSHARLWAQTNTANRFGKYFYVENVYNFTSVLIYLEKVAVQSSHGGVKFLRNSISQLIYD